jgi:hypothetical protein
MEIIAVIVAVIFWWTFWNRLNRITIAVEKIASQIKQESIAHEPESGRAPLNEAEREVQAKAHPMHKVGSLLGGRGWPKDGR